MDDIYLILVIWGNLLKNRSLLELESLNLILELQPNGFGWYILLLE